MKKEFLKERIIKKDKELKVDCSYYTKYNLILDELFITLNYEFSTNIDFTKQDIFTLIKIANELYSDIALDNEEKLKDNYIYSNKVIVDTLIEILEEI